MTERLPELYRTMLTIRRVEELLTRAHGEGRVTGSMHLCVGQEAVPAGACAALRDTDPVVATYRGHGWALARGTTPAALMAEVMGRLSELNGGRAGSAYLSDPAHHFYGENSIVGAGVPITLGLGLACRRRGTGEVPLVAIGDGAMNQGNVHESLNMASVLGVPVVVVVENNGYAEMTPSALLTAVPAARRAPAYGIEGREVDGNDPVAVWSTVASAREEAAREGRPVLVEAHTHRLVGHYSGDAQAYRPPGELAAKRADDPILRAEAALDPATRESVSAQVEQSVNEAFEHALSLPTPDPRTARSHVYG